MDTVVYANSQQLEANVEITSRKVFFSLIDLWKPEALPELATKGFPFAPKVYEEARGVEVPVQIPDGDNALNIFGFHFRKQKFDKDGPITIMIRGGEYDPVTQTFVPPLILGGDRETGPEGTTGSVTGNDGLIKPDTVTDPVSD